jgi:hypothetical protein
MRDAVRGRLTLRRSDCDPHAAADHYLPSAVAHALRLAGVALAESFVLAERIKQRVRDGLLLGFAVGDGRVSLRVTLGFVLSVGIGQLYGLGVALVDGARDALAYCKRDGAAGLCVGLRDLLRHKVALRDADSDSDRVFFGECERQHLSCALAYGVA